jgi:hypothetical protein
VTAERPTAAVLGALVALAFIVAFAAAAVLRPEVGAAPAATTLTRTAPTATREGPLVAGLTVPGLSRVAALPGLRLPVVKHKRHPKPPPAPVASAPVVRVAATVVPTPVATAAPVVVQHTAPAKPTTPNVGQAFDSSG